MRRLIAQAHRLVRCDRGGALAETALVLPMFFLVVFSLMGVGAIAWTQAALAYSVQAAARQCAVANVCAANQLSAYASTVSGITLNFASFTSDSQNCRVHVHATIAYSWVKAPLMTSAPTLAADACRS